MKILFARALFSSEDAREQTVAFLKKEGQPEKENNTEKLN